LLKTLSNAAKQLKKERSLLGNAYMAALLFYISAIFVPEAIWLLWSFPHWETMHVWNSLSEIPTAYVTAFISGDALLAVIGFWVAAKLIRSGRDYAAHIQWIAGYFAFFFVLAHGWDGTGWQRFTWDPTVTGMPWEPGRTMWVDFATSNVAITLYAMALPTIVPMIAGGYIWLRNGHILAGLDGARASSLAVKGVAIYLLGVFVAFLMAACATVISLHLTTQAGMLVGVIVTITVAYALAFRRGGILQTAISRGFNLT
jgi:hypothetical protein